MSPGPWWALLALAWAAPAPEDAADPFAACAESAATSTPRMRHRCVYMAARTSGDFARAEAILSAATVHRPWARLSLGHVRAAVGDPRAEATYQEAAELLASDAEGLTYALLGLRFLWSRAGRHDEAEQALARARTAAGEEGLLRARVDAEDARAHWRRGDAQAAVALASGHDLSGADYQLKVLTYHVLAGATLELGQVHRSWSYSERLVELTHEAGDHYVEATARLNALAMLEDHPELGDVAGLAYAEEALAVAERGGNPFSITGARCYLGTLRADPALVQQCIDEGVELDDPYTEAIGHRRLARILAEAGDAEEALPHVAEAERIAEGMGLRFTVAQAQNDRAAYLWSSDRAASEASAEAAVRTVEGIRDTHGDELARAGFASIWRTAWLSPAQRWRRAGDPGASATAFRWVERMRARELRAQRFGPSSTPEGEALKERVAALQDKLWDDLSTDDRAAVVQELAAAEAEARVALPVHELEAIQARLAADQALWVYVLPEEPHIDSWGWVVTPSELHLVELPPPHAVAGRIEALLGMSVVPEAAVAKLRAELVAPMAEVSGARRVVVVPDGPLHRLPFGLLVDDRAVTTAPSATVWAELVDDAPVRSVFSVADPEGQGLPFSRQESTRWVARLGGERRVGPAATAEGLAGALAAHDVLHVATHAEVDPALGAHTLALADGPLSAADIAAMPLDGKVVVLAACRGGDGPVFTSEGAMSLARSFLQAGARTVLTSVVPLRDDQASQLFVAVADRWADGGTLAEAVTSVQRRERQRAPGQLGWAGLVLLGDGDVVLAETRPGPRGPGARALAAGGLAGGLFLLGFAVLRRLRGGR